MFYIFTIFVFVEFSYIFFSWQRDRIDLQIFLESDKFGILGTLAASSKSHYNCYKSMCRQRQNIYSLNIFKFIKFYLKNMTNKMFQLGEMYCPVCEEVCYTIQINDDKSWQVESEFLDDCFTVIKIKNILNKKMYLYAGHFVERKDFTVIEILFKGEKRYIFQSQNPNNKFIFPIKYKKVS